MKNNSEPRRAKPKTYRQALTHWLKFYEEAVTESEARAAQTLVRSITLIPFEVFSIIFVSDVEENQ